MVYYAAWNGLPWHTKHSKDMRCKTMFGMQRHARHTQSMLGTHKASCTFGKHARHMQSPAAGMQGTHRMQNMQGIMHDTYTRHEKPKEHAHSVCTTCAVSTHVTRAMPCYVIFWASPTNQGQHCATALPHGMCRRPCL